MTELYNSKYDLQDVAREGLIKLCSEGFRMGNQTLVDISLEKLKDLDRIKTKEQLSELRTEINNLIDGKHRTLSGTDEN
jgi:hypothetical protein